MTPPISCTFRRAIPALILAAATLVAGCAAQDPAATRDVFGYEVSTRSCAAKALGSGGIRLALLQRAPSAAG